MVESTLTDKGQTTVPRQVREALGLKPRSRLQWDIEEDGTVIVKPEPSALTLFGSLKSKVPFPGIKEEKDAVCEIMASEAAQEGSEG
ncbi:MAG: antitoxin PrlF [Verrucomicrobiales bacterium]|jgi:antitoxin PrlF